MEFTQFISYLDYGVLGLSAIILILSFVLLSREQKREVFRPEVASAIRKYMMLALAFAAVGLISTIVDGVMVQPSKEEKKMQDERTDLLSRMIAEDVEKRINRINIGAEIPSEIEDAVLDLDGPNEPKNNEPKGNTDTNTNVEETTTTNPVVPDEPDKGSEIDSLVSVDEKSEVKKEEEEVLVIIEQYHLDKDKTLGKGVVNNLKGINEPAARIMEQRLTIEEEE